MLILTSSTIDYASALQPLPCLNPSERRFTLDTLVQHRLTTRVPVVDAPAWTFTWFIVISASSYQHATAI
jgi:hypothetical protein